MVNVSRTIEMETPIARPTTASATAQPMSRAAVIAEASTAGHLATRANVSPTARTVRAIAGVPAAPGNGTKTNAPLTRARTSRKAHRVPKETSRLTSIASQISQQRDGV
jgi:hypothetical protein